MTTVQHSNRPAGEDGFTLAELLVAVVLLSLLSAALAGGLRFSLKAWDLGMRHADGAGEKMAAQAFLRREIEAAYPLFVTDDPTRPYVDFEGRRDAVRFLAETPMALGDAARSHLAIALERKSAGQNIMVTAAAELSAGGSAGESKTLVFNVASLELSYFGRARADHAATWHDQWIGEKELPKLVRIHVGFPAGDLRSWPDPLVAPRIRTDVGCLYDPLTKRCRGR
jgi:general secretion pathway protein J